MASASEIEYLVNAKEELQKKIFLNNEKFLWIQHPKLSMMTLPFLRSVVVGFHKNIAKPDILAKRVETLWLGTAATSSLQSRCALFRFPLV